MPREILLLSRPGCIFCQQVRELLTEAGVWFKHKSITDRAQQEEIVNRHRAVAFPIVLVDGEYLGGYTHVLKLHSDGRLKQLNDPLSDFVAGRAAPTPASPVGTTSGTPPRPITASLGAVSTTPTTARMPSLAQGFAALGEAMRKKK